MRACIMAAGLFLSLGGLTMGRTATAQEPTEFKFEGTVFNERVTVKQFKARQKEFLKPVAGVWAVRKDTKEKGLMFHIVGTTKPGADLTKQPGVFRVGAEPGSILTDAAGNEYTVAESEGNDDVLWVKLTKEAPKKKR